MQLKAENISFRYSKKHPSTDYFKLALATNVHEFIEYKYARLELELMASESAG